MQKQEYVNPFVARQLREYGESGLKYIQSSAHLAKYVARKSTASKNSGDVIRSRLNRFAFFAFTTYPKTTTFDAFLGKVKSGTPDPYDLLADFAEYLKTQNFKANQIRQLVRAAKQFMRSKIVGVLIDNETFRDNVSLPRQQFPDFEGTEKSQVQELLSGCKNQRLKTALLLMAAMGPRAVEACAVRHVDLRLEPDEKANEEEKRNFVPTITFRAEFAKMGRARTRPLTRELKEQLQLWENTKYQPHYVSDGGRHYIVTPEIKPDDLVLAHWHKSKKPKPGEEEEPTAKPSGIYDSIYHDYLRLANVLKMGKKNGRRVVTFHRLRAFAKTTIENLGGRGFAEWWIGHGRDTYYRNSASETMKLFKQYEVALTFLDLNAFEKRDARIESELESQRDINRTLQEQMKKIREENEDFKRQVLESIRERNPKARLFKEDAYRRGIKIEKN